MKTIETKAVTYNAEQRLFVIPGNGYSCLGIDVCRERIGRLAHELGETHTANNEHTRYESPLAMYAEYERLVSKASERNQKTGWRSTSELTPQLIGLEGKRVEVVHQWDSGTVETDSFWVGKSGGFIPCHLAIHRRSSFGGTAVCLGTIKSIRVIATRK